MCIRDSVNAVWEWASKFNCDMVIFNDNVACKGMNGVHALMEEHFALLKPVKTDRFITTIIDPPLKGDRTSLDYYKAQLKACLLYTSPRFTPSCTNELMTQLGKLANERGL